MPVFGKPIVLSTIARVAVTFLWAVVFSTMAVCAHSLTANVGLILASILK